MPRYFANVARERRRIAPEDLPGAIGVTLDPARPGDVVGMAFAAGHLGGFVEDRSRRGPGHRDLGPREAVWRIVLGKAEVDGRFVLRSGEFVELGEGAE